MTDEIGRHAYEPPRIDYEKYQGKPPPDDGVMTEIAEQVIEALISDLPEQFDELVQTYDGSSVAVGVFGIGTVTIAVSKGEILLNPESAKCPPLLGRAATYPEVISAFARGSLTPMEAFHRGDLIVQVQETDELHRAYDFIVRFSGAALASARLRDLLATFEGRSG